MTVLHRLFEEQASRTPERTAVTSADVTLSYGELDRRSQALAAALHRSGLGPGKRIGILASRSPALLIGILGVLKSGATCIPLDAAEPAAGQAVMLAEAAACAVACEPALQPLLSGCGLPLVPLDQGVEAEGDAPRTACSPDDTAWLAFTSGATGPRRVVGLRHGTLANAMASLCRACRLSPEDVLLALTPAPYGMAIVELFLPLVGGGTVAIAEPAAVTRGGRLAACLENSGATVMQAPPALWRRLLESGWKGSPRLKKLCGGDVLDPVLARALLQDGAPLWHVYGALEAGVWTLIHEVVDAPGPVPFGNPLDGCDVRLLDAYRQPAPIGVPAEIWVSGHGTPAVATGDLGRWLDDGSLQFQGRLARQARLPGGPVEPLTVENALVQHPSVREAMVVGYQPTGRGIRLVGYVVLEARTAFSPPALRTWIRRVLPRWMECASFVALDALPLTPDGKRDACALPPPDESRLELEQLYDPPQTPEQEALARIWAEALGVEHVGIRDNFFELGGTSLLAAMVYDRIQAVFGLWLAPERLFANPTILEQARLLVETGPHSGDERTCTST